MDVENLDALACPACKGPLRTDDARDGRLIDGVLRCEACSTVFPVARGFALFGEGRLDDGKTDVSWVRSSSERWFRGDAEYEAFLRKKGERKTYDAYAMFQPFNESLRALLGFIEPIRERLSPGDLILDTWCRTGWSGEWIASLFPEQRVLSIWEGDVDVLGYSGFAYWLGEGRRAANWDIIFTHPDEPFPLRTHAVKFLHGYESLHRYRPSNLLAECRRVTAEDGALVLSHIHLTNDEPDPWFDRGCIQLHGTLYRGALDRIFGGTGRKGLIFGERSIFESGESFTLEDAPDTEDYNAAVLIGDATWEGRTCTTEHHPPVTDGSRFVVNPLLDFDLAVGRVGWSRETREGQVGHVLDRHPCYERRIAPIGRAPLRGRQPELVYYAAQSMTFGEIAQRLGGDRERLRAEASELVAKEILRSAAMSSAMARLQEYFRTVEFRDPGEARFASLWGSLAARYGDRPILVTEDGTEFTPEIVDSLASATAGWLLADTEPGDRVLLHAPNCPEAYIVIWACWLTGRVIVPVEPDLPLDAVEGIIARAGPRLAFATERLSIPTHQLDSLADEDDPRPTFSQGIAAYLEAEPPTLPEVDPASDAAILFTSGSTGRPKGVRLHSGGLTSSGIELARCLDWRPGDRLYAGGASYSMSGLRNPALGALAAGATIVIPDAAPMNPLRSYALLRQQAVSIVSTVPAQMSAWVALRDRLKQEPRPAALRSIAHTGHGLSDTIRQEIIDWLAVEVTGYYGLTETCGLCLGDAVGQRAQGNIGGPIAALAQVVDEHGTPVADGERGELRVTSPRIMSGYLEPDTVSAVRLWQGWLYTGDAAVRMPDGSFELVGRFDDQVKDRFGDTVFPSEVEGVTAEVAGVADCCCLAQRDETALASLVLFLVLEDGAERARVEATVLETIDARLGIRKRPRRFVFCESLPRRTSGKIDRAALLRQTGLED